MGMENLKNRIVNKNTRYLILGILLIWQILLPKGYFADSKNKVNILSNSVSIKPALQMPGDLIITRHAPSINGSRVEGNIRVLLPESFSINSNAVVTGSIYVPGTPRINRNGNGTYRGTITGTGNPQPTNHTINLNSNTTVNHIFTQTDAIEMPTVPIPPTPQGNRDVSLNQGQSPGDFSTIKNLTINSNYGQLEIPQGTYGNFVANSNSIFAFGVEGQATTYNLTGLTLNSNSQLIVRGSVTINLLNQISLNSNCKVGNVLNPVALSLNIARGGLTLNSNAEFYGVITAPTGTFSINSNSKLTGLVICDRATLNANSLLKPIASDVTGPELTVDEPVENQVINTATTNVSGTVDDDSVVISVKVNSSNAIINNNSYSLNDFPLTPGTNTINVIATDIFGNSSTVVRTVTRSGGVNQAPVVNAGNNQTITLPNNSVNLLGQVTDDGLPNPPSQVTVLWSKKDGNGTVTFSSQNSLATTATFSNSGTYTLTLTASDSELQSSDDVVITVNPEAQNNVAPTVSAGPDQTITLPSSATLSATATDDGLPNPPAQLTVSWSKLEGNGAVTFSAQTSLITEASFSQAGTYVLRVSVSDSELIATDEITVIVNPAAVNQAPTVDAGDTQNIVLPAIITLTGTAQDDGLPNNTLTYLWQKVSGPGEVEFETANQLSTVAIFDHPGAYIVSLTVSDGALQTTDTVTLNLNIRARISINCNPDGFDPDELSVSAGEKVLTIRNRSGEDINFTFSQGSTSLNVIAPAGKNIYLDVNLVVGTAQITAVGHPDFSCTITVTP